MVDAIANQFVSQYYATFDSNRAGLVALYTNGSQLDFEGKKFVGPEAIGKKLIELPFQTVQHVVTTLDFQQTDTGLLIFVIGQLKTDNDPPHSFSQVFLLKQVGDSLFIFNDMFRLGLHHS